MATTTKDLQAYCLQTAQQAKAAATELAIATTSQKNEWLAAGAQTLRDRAAGIISANQQDIEAAPGFGLSDAQIDRLRLDTGRIQSIAAALDEIARLPDPIGETIEAATRPNGLQISKVRVPLGVVFFVYESRPNVTADASAICLKSGNAVILRGGKEAAHSSRMMVDLLTDQLEHHGLPRQAIQLVETPDRDAVGHFLKCDQLIDVAIPRGGEGLIRRVADEARMPVIKHFHGNCHVYVDRDANLEMAEQVVVNSKCQRSGVCNAAESLLIHRDLARTFLPRLAEVLRQQGVELRGDAATCDLVDFAEPATEEDYATEYLDHIASVCVVDDLDQAIEHINRYGSHHTDAIVTESLTAAREFTTRVDSAAVMVNASTRFNDGGEFGLGAEIGISTDKFHARGPCGLRELTSYKYVVVGTGHIR